MRKLAWSTPWILAVLALSEVAVPRPLLAGEFQIPPGGVSTPILTTTPGGQGISFAVHASARWEGGSATNGFNRIFRSFWWTSLQEWCNNQIPAKHCATDGRVFAAPPFFDTYTINCNSGRPEDPPCHTGNPSKCACAASKYVIMPFCNNAAIKYWGKANVVNLHSGTSIDDEKFAPQKLDVPCRPAREPRVEPCFTLVNLFVLPVIGGAQLAHALPDSRMESLRTEIHGSTRFVMDEWAILAVDAGEDGRIIDVESLAASSGGYANFREAGLIEAIAVTRESTETERWDLLGKARLDAYFRPGRSILLAVDEPVHPRNERWIEKPVPRLLPGRVEVPGDEAVAVVRADFGQDRSLLALDVLYAERPLTRSEQAFLESHLALEYASGKSHRAVLFAVVRLGEAVSLERSQTVMVQCCCEVDPETGECEVPGPI
jgi:hypothetical protein